MKRVIDYYFAMLAVLYYDKMFHVPFQALNDIEKRRFLIDFGLDADMVSEEEYINAKI